MAYIGRQNLGGAYRQLDDISSSFNGSLTTFTMQVNAQNITLGDVNQIILSLGGVIQKPNTDFTISGSTLTFTTAPAANTSFFAILLGSDNGGTVTPTDASVTTAKIADANVTKAKLADSVDIFAGTSLSAADLGAGVHIKTGDSGASVSSTSDELVIEGSSVGMSFLDATDGATRIAFGDSGDNDIGKIVYGHSSNQMEFVTNTATGLVIDGDGHVTKPKQPAFHAQLNTTATNIAVGSYTIPTLSIERFDRGGDYNTSTYEFTCPVAGLYHFEAYVRLQELDSAATYYGMRIEGSNLTIWNSLFQTAGTDRDPAYYDMRGSHFVDCDANDVVYVKIIQSGGSQQVDIGEGFFSGRLVC